ncbi:MAG: ABC transporter ATP-binding protein/permease [Veillonellaceae bacterium]|nr:ABC transporter ATP-binding protein/permease [Veillonellaceae bacterium]
MGSWFGEHRRDWQQIRVLLTYSREHLPLLGFCAFLMLGSVGLDLLRPYLLKYAIAEIFPASDAAGLQRLVWFYLGTVVASVVMLYLQNYYLQYVGQRVIYHIRQDAFHKILSKSEVALGRYKSGSLVTKVTNDTDAIRSLFVEVLVPLGGDFLMMFGILAVMLWLDVRLALTSFVVVGVLAVAVHYFQKFGRRAYRRVRSSISASNSYIQEMMSGISVVKSVNAENKVYEEYENINRQFLSASLQEVQTFGIFRPLVDFAYFLCVLLVLAYTNWVPDITDAALVFIFTQYIEKFFVPVRGMAERYNILQSALAGADRVWELWSDNDEEEEDRRPDFTEEFRELEFRDIWFRYEEDGPWVLRDVSLRVRAGEMIGVVGASGAGKTTLMSLAMRLYVPQRGALYLNGKPMEDYSVHSTRKLLGYVFQSQHLFKGTVADNISLHNPELTEERIREALQAVNMWSDIQELPAGIRTQAGYLGSYFSSGERQLLALARIMARRYPVLILDEATANMDSETEKRIQQSLASIRKTHTVMVIAHRLSTIRTADRIYVFADGRLVQTGDYDELAAADGYFKRLLEA